MGETTFHSTLSPSGRHRWGACPGSVRLEAQFPEQAGGPAALDGTRTHAILEYCVKSNMIGPLHLIGTEFEYEHECRIDKFRVDQDRAGRVNQAIEYIRARAAEQGTTPIAEQRVYPDGLVDRADMHGTVDVQIPGKQVYEIIDYKDGMGVVSAENNPQLKQYGIGVLAGLPAEEYPKKFRLTVIQPKLATKGMPIISSWDISTKDLLADAEAAKAQAAATEDPNAPLVPGESQCKFCRAKGACPALAAKSMQEVGLMFSPVNPTPDPRLAITEAELVSSDTWPLEVVDFVTAEPAFQAANQEPTTMSDAQLRQILEAAPLVKQMLAGVEAEVERRLMAGIPVPGFKLVNGRGTRKWALPEDEIVKKLVGMGIPKADCYEKKLISPAQAEKMVFEKKGEPTKLSDAQIKRLNTEYVTTMAGKPTVASEDDPRQAVITDASPMFKAVEPPPSPWEMDVPPTQNLTPAMPDWLAPLPDWLR